MHAIQIRYFPALADYIRTADEESLSQAGSIARDMQGVHPEEIIAVHEEAMQNMIANVESEEALKLYHRSFMFLIELMAAYRFQIPANAPEELRFKHMRELLSHSQRSFHHVKNKYENVLQHMDSGIALFDSRGLLTFVNLQLSKLIEIPRKMLIGCTIKEIVRNRELSRSTRKMIIRLYKEMFIRRFRYYEYQDSKGRHLLVTVTYGDQLDGDYLISIKDVSEYKLIEQNAYQNDKLAMLGKIAASIAHEIRNPLTSIRGFIQLLQPHLLQLGKEEYARIILTEIDRANDIIYEFLNSSKPSAPLKQRAELVPLLKEVILLSDSEALMRNCSCQLEPTEEKLFVSIDIKQIKQVILNMVKNAFDAVEAMEQGRNGRIEVAVRRHGNYAEVSITDNGKGMDRQTMSRLFDPFFTTKESGTGLGLSVSYRIIHNHGGHIQLESQVGEGTSFYIYLPLTP